MCGLSVIGLLSCTEYYNIYLTNYLQLSDTTGDSYLLDMIQSTILH